MESAGAVLVHVVRPEMAADGDVVAVRRFHGNVAMLIGLDFTRLSNTQIGFSPSSLLSSTASSTTISRFALFERQRVCGCRRRTAAPSSCERSVSDCRAVA